MLAGAVVALALLQAEGWTPKADWRRYFPEALLAYEIPCNRFPSHNPPYRPFTEDSLKGAASQIEAAGEEPLLTPSKSDPALATYRFTYLRTFNPPVVVRLDQIKRGAWRLTAKRLSGNGGYAPGVVEASEQRMLSSGEVALLEASLKAYDAPNLPAAICAPIATDGAEWMFEMRTAGGYSLAREQSPRKGPLRVLGLVFLGLSSVSGLPIY